MWPGYITESNPKGVHLIAPEDMAKAEPGAWDQTKPLYVPDAFELAGVPVPEGVLRLWSGGLWFCVSGKFVEAYRDRDRAWGRYGGDILQHERTPDFSRTPIADAWECLPLFVREKMEALLA